MTVDIARAAVITGDGLVARYPGLLCVARCSDREVLLTLLDVCATAAGPDPGRALARSLAKWMGGPDAPGDDLEFGTVAAMGNQLGVFLVGAVSVAVPGSPVALSGSDAATWTDRLIAVPDAPVVLALEGAHPPADLAYGINDLRAGVVPGAGAVLFPVGRAAAPRPEPAGLSGLDGPTISTTAHGGAARSGLIGDRQAAPGRPAVAHEAAATDGVNGSRKNGLRPNGSGNNGLGQNGAGRDGAARDEPPGLLAEEPSAAEGPSRTADPRKPHGYEWFADRSEGGVPSDPAVATSIADTHGADVGGAETEAVVEARWPWTGPPADRGGVRPGDGRPNRSGPGFVDTSRPAFENGGPAGSDDDRLRAFGNGRPAVPDAAVPDAAVPDAAVPDAAVPDAAVPDDGRSAGLGDGRPADPPEGRPGALDGGRLRVPEETRPGSTDHGRPGRGAWTEPPAPARGSARPAPPAEREQVWVDPPIPDEPADQLHEGRHAILESAGAEPVDIPEPAAPALAPPTQAEEAGCGVITPADEVAAFDGADDATPVNAVPAVQPEPVAAPEVIEPRAGSDDRAPDRAAGPAPRPTPAPRQQDLLGPGEVRPDGPLLQGLLCGDGHLNDPRSSSCVVCEAALAPGVDVLGPRPPLGRIVFDDGATFTVDTEYLVGRMPEADPRARSGELLPIVVEDRSGSVSRVHAEILIDGWDVVLVDSGSRNGTFVAGPDDSGWTPLAPGRTSILLPGTRVRMGGRTFVFEPSGSSDG